MMKKNIVKKGIILSLAAVSVVVAGYNYACGDKKIVNAETVYDSIADSEKDKIEEIIDTEIKELDVNEDLSSEENVVYEDADDNIYQFEDEEVVSYYNCEDSNMKMKLSKEQIETLAKEYLNTISDEKGYVLYEEKYNEYRETYKFYYYKYLGEYRTSDVVYIEIDEFGVIQAFANPNEGIFDNVKIKEMSYEDISNKAVELSNYDKNNFEISVEDIMIIKEDSLKYQVILLCYDKNTDITYDEVVNIDVEELYEE